MAGLYTDLGMKILGGCCGTDERHIEKLARLLTLKK
jgi:methionine synthase I (cobalamin-dependent)